MPETLVSDLEMMERTVEQHENQITKTCHDSKTKSVTDQKVKDDIEVELISSSGETFLVSKENLIISSEYFQGLFSSGMKESLMRRVELPTVESEALDNIVKYLTGKDMHLCLDLNSVKDVIVAANYLQMSPLLSTCLSFLQSNITVEECYSLQMLGQDMMIPALVKLMEDFIKLHLEEFVQTEDFLSFTPEQVTTLLSSDAVFVDKEISIFNAIVHWFNANYPLDKYNSGELRRMIQCVRFGLLTEQERLSCIQRVADLPESVKQVVSSSSCFSDYQVRIHRDKTEWHTLRAGSSELSLMLIGGFTRKSENSTNRVQLMPLEELACRDHSQSDRLYKFSMTSKIRLPEPICEHATCVIDNYLYVAGGQRTYYVDGRSTQNSVWRFDPRICLWIKVSSMKKPRSLFCLLSLGGSMYAVCGWLEPERVNRSVERYDPVTDSWHFVAPITIGLHEHAGCSCQGHLYVSGGYKGPARGHLDQLWKYDPAADSWNQLCPMYQARSYHCMVALDGQNKLLVAGGVCSAGELFNDIQNYELYDMSTNQWTTVSPIPLPASCMPCLLHNNQLYLFGGHAFQEGNSKHDRVQILDVGSWTWDVRTMDTLGILCSTVSLLSFPKSWLRKELAK